MSLAQLCILGMSTDAACVVLKTLTSWFVCSSSMVVRCVLWTVLVVLNAHEALIIAVGVLLECEHHLMALREAAVTAADSCIRLL